MDAPEITRTDVTRRMDFDTLAGVVETLRVLDRLGIPWEVRSHDVPAPFGGPGDIDRSYIILAPS